MTLPDADLAAIEERDRAFGEVVGETDAEGWTVVTEGAPDDDQPATDRRNLLAHVRGLSRQLVEARERETALAEALERIAKAAAALAFGQPGSAEELIAATAGARVVLSKSETGS